MENPFSPGCFDNGGKPVNDALIPELELLAFSFLSGAICFFVYDLLLVLRIFFRPVGLFEKTEDILYWLAASFFVFSVIYIKNSGVIRAYSIAGMLVGMLLYRAIMRDRMTAFAVKKSNSIKKWFSRKAEPIRKKKLELQTKRRQSKIEKKEQKKVRKELRKKKKERRKCREKRKKKE